MKMKGREVWEVKINSRGSIFEAVYLVFATSAKEAEARGLAVTEDEHGKDTDEAELYCSSAVFRGYVY